MWLATKSGSNYSKGMCGSNCRVLTIQVVSSAEFMKESSDRHIWKGNLGPGCVKLNDRVRALNFKHLSWTIRLYLSFMIDVVAMWILGIEIPVRKLL